MGVEHGKGDRPIAETEIPIINVIEADRFSDEVSLTKSMSPRQRT